MSKILEILQRLDVPAKNIFDAPAPPVAAAAVPLAEPAAPSTRAVETRLIPIASGKGGVGKTNLAVNLAIALADSLPADAPAGRVILVDCDFGLPNADILLGTRETRTLDDFVARKIPTLAEAVVPTSVPRLSFLSGAANPSMTLSNLQYQQRQKFLRHFRSLEADYIVLDLGASVHFEVIDFFSMVNSGIVVTNPEPTALRDCYLFLRATLLRKIRQEAKEWSLITDYLDLLESRQLAIPSVPGLLHQIQREGQLIEYKALKAIVEGCQPKVIINRCESEAEGAEAARRLCDEARRELGIELGYLGPVANDAQVVKAVKDGAPFLRRYPDSIAAVQLRELCGRVVENEEFELEKNYFSFGAYLRRIFRGATTAASI